MATFKVGQRVKRIADPAPTDPFGFASFTTMPLGMTGTVTHLRARFVRVVPDGRTASWPCYPHTLAPLTDPKADQFIERIKKLKPYEEPVAPKSKVRA